MWCKIYDSKLSNLRNILLQTRKVNVDQLDFRDIQQLQYYPTKVGEKWKENLGLEILNSRNNNLEVDGFTDSELDEILQHLCSDWIVEIFLLSFRGFSRGAPVSTPYSTLSLNPLYV